MSDNKLKKRLLNDAAPEPESKKKEKPKPKPGRRRSHNFKFLVWWHYQSYCTTFTAFFLGLSCVLWSNSAEAEAKNYSSLILGILVMALSLVWYIDLLWSGLRVPKEGIEDRCNFPIRAAMQGIFTVVTLCSGATAWAGYMAAWTAATGAYGFYQGERGVLDPPKKKPPSKSPGSGTGSRNKAGSRTSRIIKAVRVPGRQGDINYKHTGDDSDDDTDSEEELMEQESVDLCTRFMDLTYCCKRCWREQQRGNRVPLLVWLGLYISANAIIFIYQSQYWFPYASDNNLSSWVGFAKVSGKMLDFNCAVLLIPVTRSLMLLLNKSAESSSFSCARWIPLRHNIAFHKLCAMVVLVLAIVHVIAHYLNFVFNASETLSSFSYGPWITGPLICAAMFHIYSAAPELVRRSKYLVFWYNHHAFIFFYLLLFVHMVQIDTYFKQFFPYAIVPVVLYIIERVMRVMRGNRPVLLKRVKWIEPVLEVHFEPWEGFQFKEGQYLYLNVPSIDPPFSFLTLLSSWHPFTISSAYGDMTELNENERFVSCHIKVWPGGWTEQLKNYFEQMNPTEEYPFVFDRWVDGKKKVGKLLGPEGNVLLRVDGPHSSPSQHYDEYKTLMVVGVGVGMTPCASILRAVLLYKWTNGFNPEMIYFYWGVRHKEVFAFQWFVGMLTQLLDVTADNRAKGKIKNHHFSEVHIFVTSYKEGQRPTSFKEHNIALTSNLRALEAGGSKTDSNSSVVNKAGFSADQLFDLLAKPPTSVDEYAACLRQAAKNKKVPRDQRVPLPNRLSNIWVWNGRPKWDPVFEDVAKRRPMDSEYIGVCFCGMSVIGAQLQRMCEKHSRAAESLIFKLHMENF